MSNHDNGGPAFPVPVAATPDGSIYHSMEVGGSALGGMTLRDYFAAKALSGLLATESEAEGFYTAASVAERAYAIADAMLAEREKENNDASR